MNSSVSKNTVVSIHYTLRDKNNEILETSSEETPLFYLHGHGQIIRGLEKALAGKNVGDQFSVTVSPEDGYGVYNPELVVELERKQFPPEADLSVGDMFEAALGDGEPVMIRITSIQDENITVDGNHPLAGQELTFEVQVVKIRPATKEELAHGHAHHGDGHHHH